MLPSPLTLRIGSSIGEIGRCFRGQVDEFRIWRTAVTDFDLGLSPDEQLQVLAQAMCIQVRLPGAGDVVPDATATWSFSLDELFTSSVPDVVQEIVVELEAEDWRADDPISLPPVTLVRQSGFESAYRPALKPGYYRVQYRSVMVVAGQRIVGAAKHQRWKQLLAVAIPGEGSRLTHERPNDVAVIDPGLLLSARPGKGLDRFVPVAYLSLGRMDS